MFFRLTLVIAFVSIMVIPASAEEDKFNLPDTAHIAFDHLFSLFQADTELDQDQLTGLIDFVQSTSPGSSGRLKERQGASGAYHTFTIDRDLSHLMGYAYNPDIPAYVTMPSSVQKHEWLTVEAANSLRELEQKAKELTIPYFLRGREQEAITPDSNTGGYYLYSQDRLVTVIPDYQRTVLISATRQTTPSEVGRKGCVVGDDKNWNYLYSDEKGINTTGLSWVDSYMYFADSVIVYVADPSGNTLQVASFKWLNAGWAKINMVKASHILEGIKRFATDFKDILEAPSLPDPESLERKYAELKQTSEEQLRQLVSPYFAALSESEDIKSCPSSFRKMVSSGEYLANIERDEMVRILLLEYVKMKLGRAPLLSTSADSTEDAVLVSSP